MKSVTLTKRADGNTVTVACPLGHRLRILVAAGTVVASGTAQGVCQLTSQNQTLWTGVTNQMTNTTTQAVFALGSALNVANQAQVDPVSGVVIMDGGSVVFTAPLPDVWFDTDVSVFIAGATPLVVVYELTAT